MLTPKRRPNGRRYRQARELADKATRRRIRHLGLNPESVGECPHLSGARGVGQVLQDGFEFELDTFVNHCIYWWAVIAIIAILEQEL